MSELETVRKAAERIADQPRGGRAVIQDSPAIGRLVLASVLDRGDMHDEGCPAWRGYQCFCDIRFIEQCAREIEEGK